MSHHNVIAFQVPVSLFISSMGYSNIASGEPVTLQGWLTVTDKDQVHAFMLRDGIVLFIAPNGAVVNVLVNGVARSMCITAENYQPHWESVPHQPLNREQDEPLMCVELMGPEIDTLYQSYKDTMESTAEKQTTEVCVRPKYS